MVLPLTYGRKQEVTPGVLDDRAHEAFTCGQCHAFALALHQITGWPLYLLCHDASDPIESWTHVVVRRLDGAFIDIDGECWDLPVNWGAVAVPTNKSTVYRLPGRVVPIRVKAAEPFARAVLAQLG